MGFAISITKQSRQSTVTNLLLCMVIQSVWKLRWRRDSDPHFRTKGPVSAIVFPFKVRGAISHTKKFSKLRLSQLAITYRRGKSKYFRCSLCPNDLTTFSNIQFNYCEPSTFQNTEKPVPFLTPDAAVHFDCTASFCTTAITVPYLNASPSRPHCRRICI